MTREQIRLQEAQNGTSHGGSGDLTSANASGERFAKTTAMMAMPGIISAMTKLVPTSITGARTVLPVSMMRSSFFASASLYGMAMIPYCRDAVEQTVLRLRRGQVA